MIDWFETGDGDKWCFTGPDEIMFRTVATEEDFMTTYISKETLLEMLEKLENAKCRQKA